MIYFGMVVLFLAVCSGEKHLCNTLAAESVNEFAVVVKCAIIEDTFYEQCIADVMLLIFGRVPEKSFVLVYDLLARHIVPVSFCFRCKDTNKCS